MLTLSSEHRQQAEKLSTLIVNSSENPEEKINALNGNVYEVLTHTITLLTTRAEAFSLIVRLQIECLRNALLSDLAIEKKKQNFNPVTSIIYLQEDTKEVIRDLDQSIFFDHPRCSRANHFSSMRPR